MCSLDLEVCPVWREQVRIARKRHACDSCWRAIQPGEAYLAHSHVFDGSAASEKMCAACAIVRDDFAAHHRMTPMPSDTAAQIRDCITGDEASEWRPHLAVIQWRRHGTHDWSKRLERVWMRRAVSRQLALTRHVLRKRAL